MGASPDGTTAGLRARPEARWALWSGIAGALATAALSVKGIFASGSSTAALGFVYLPLVAALGAIPVAAWGAALGHVVLRWRGAVDSPPLVLLAALAVTAALPAMLAIEVDRGLRLEAAVREVQGMDVAQLEHAYEQSPFHRDRYFLAAIAQNRAARAGLLGRIATLRDPELYEPMGSLWDVMGSNRKGIAVMRLVASHANTDAATLAKLAADPNVQRIVHELAANPKTPPAVLERWFDSTDELVERGLALNARTPQRVLMRLAASPNPQTRVNLARNRETPREILDRLALDADPGVARDANIAIELRKN
jgi:hypothetical protein